MVGWECYNTSTFIHGRPNTIFDSKLPTVLMHNPGGNHFEPVISLKKEVTVPAIDLITGNVSNLSIVDENQAVKNGQISSKFSFWPEMFYINRT